MEINNDLEIMENFIKGNNWTTRVLFPFGEDGMTGLIMISLMPINKENWTLSNFKNKTKLF